MHLAAPPPISKLRLARLMSWARLWLTWLAANLTARFGACAPRRRLEPIRTMLAHLLFLHAAARVAPRPRTQSPIPNAPPRAGLLRALVGGGLRRALRGATIGALLAIVGDPEAGIAKLARRLARGLTRRRRNFAAPLAVAWAGDAPALRAAGADTS